jgi:hypothetical protein
MADDDPNLGNAEYMEGLEALRNLAAIATGIRADLIEQGWTAEGAEQVTIAAFRKAMGQ